MSFDVVILGLGAMGSAAAQHLAARGSRVLGIEQFTPPHDRGSSHGGSRIIRQAYFESPDYIPLILRAYALWRKLEHESGRRLLHATGGLVIGPGRGQLVPRSLEAASRHGIGVELLEGAELARRFPVFNPQPDDVAVLEHEAGYLVPEECIRLQLECARKGSAELRFEEKVLAWSACSDHVEVRTDKGFYRAGHLVIALGPWAEASLQANFPVRVTRQVMAWLQPRSNISEFVPGTFPVFIAEDIEGGRAAYGMPAIDGPGGGVKTAIHGSDEVCSPDTIDRSVHESDIAEIRRRVAPRLPLLNGELVRAKTCLYTMTPDEHFIIGAHPRHPSCTIACGFSGHGFKFAPVVGEILADLATTGTTAQPISLFSPGRFLSGPDRPPS